MYSKEYSKRLVQFNSTDKYQRELYKLKQQLNALPEHDILDYGCGIGTAMRYINSTTGATVRGFDVNHFVDLAVPDEWMQYDAAQKFDCIYFMHSLAHIPHPDYVLRGLVINNLKPNGKIVVMTPNKMWLRAKNGGQDIKSDDTVVEHFAAGQLRDLMHSAGLQVAVIDQYSAFAQDNLPDAEHVWHHCERLYSVAYKKPNP
jgi:trans-aconitate methyltransferase